ncbi:core-2/I-branching enzyme-domain-containing protein [Entophlyctis helioformis]|nr:core-2/I-branching enzyme-domain-containing protein [Entophlyctis helioformis]
MSMSVHASACLAQAGSVCAFVRACGLRPIVAPHTSANSARAGAVLQDYFVPDTVPEKPRMTAEERRFLMTLPQRKPPEVQPGIKYFDAASAGAMAKAQRLRKFKLAGFQYCKMLDGSIFDSLAIVHALGGSTAAVNPPAIALIKLMDELAVNITEFIKVKFEQVDPLEAQRYACYAVAEGNNPSANLTDTRFVYSFDPDSYFASVLPAVSRTAPVSAPARKRYLMAFLIMVHEEVGFNQLKMLLDILDDGNAIILIHVDLSATRLHRLITDYLASRDKLKAAPKGNVFLAQNRFANVWGHISLVFSQLSGFWELADMAEWDYIVNLSNYDWPLRNNPEMHRVLQLHPGFSWIDYWNDTEAVAERSLRPHLAKADRTAVYHPPELSITSWPFPHWKAYKQMQWMILSRGAITYLRQDKSAINYLAFMEHSQMPEESFFSTALVNSKRFSKLLKRDKKRYVRSPGDISSPAWIGWSDRHIFGPASAMDDPEFLFLRPFNALGEFFGETKLLEWIRINHLNLDPRQTCYRDQLGYRDECIREIASTVADHNELILVPVNMAYMRIVDNLRCSLLRAGMRNVIHWAIDIQTHDKLIEAGLLSFFIPNAKGSPNRYMPHTKDFLTIMRYKGIVIKRLLNAGFHVIYLDADTVVTQDFRESLRQYAGGPGFADVAVGIDEVRVVPSAEHVKAPPKANAGIAYYRNTERAKQLVDDIIRRQEYDPMLDDQEAMREALAQPRHVLWTGIGFPDHDAYPGGSTHDGDGMVDTAAGGQGASSGGGAGKADAAGGAAGGSASKNDGGNSGNSGSGGSALGSFAELLGLSPSSPPPLRFRDDGRIRVHFLDQVEYMSGGLYFKHHDLLPPNFSGYRVIHASGQTDPEAAFRSQGLWYVDGEGRCLAPQAQPVRGDGDEDGAAAGARGAGGESADTRYNEVVKQQVARAGGQGGRHGRRDATGEA